MCSLQLSTAPCAVAWECAADVSYVTGICRQNNNNNTANSCSLDDKPRWRKSSQMGELNNFFLFAIRIALKNYYSGSQICIIISSNQSGSATYFVFWLYIFHWGQCHLDLEDFDVCSIYSHFFSTELLLQGMLSREVVAQFNGFSGWHLVVCRTRLIICASTKHVATRLHKFTVSTRVWRLVFCRLFKNRMSHVWDWAQWVTS